MDHGKRPFRAPLSPQARVAMKRGVLPLLLIAAALLAVPGPARAQDDGAPPAALFRIYYSPYFAGTVERSPADPDGDFTDEPPDLAHKVELEAILWGHLGLSVGRTPFYRKFQDDQGRLVDEHAEERYANLTLYARRSAHNQFNLFLGAGQGTIAEYRVKGDGQRTDQAPLHRDLDLQRQFAGVEYTFDRLGVRLEAVRTHAENEEAGRKTELDRTMQYLTFYIPLN